MAPGRGHGCGCQQGPACATGEAGGHARTAGTATTILPIVGVTPAGPTPRRAVPPRLYGPTQGSRSPTSRLVPSSAPRSIGIIATWRLRLITPHVEHGLPHVREPHGGYTAAAGRGCPMELSLPPSPAHLVGLRRAA